MPLPPNMPDPYWPLVEELVIIELTTGFRILGGACERLPLDEARVRARELVTAARMANHPSNKLTLENLDDAFTYHRPTDAQVPKYEAINLAAKAFAKTVLENAPDCADRSSALRLVNQARMEANSAIARDPVEAVTESTRVP